MQAPESLATGSSMPVPTQRPLGDQQRNGLALHVRAHQGAVGVVVLEERHERGGNRDDLHRRDVHVVDAGGLDDAGSRRASGQATESVAIRSFSSGVFAWATIWPLSASALRYSTSPSLPLTTLR